MCARYCITCVNRLLENLGVQRFLTSPDIHAHTWEYDLARMQPDTQGRRPGGHGVVDYRVSVGIARKHLLKIILLLLLFIN